MLHPCRPGQSSIRESPPTGIIGLPLPAEFPAKRLVSCSEPELPRWSPNAAGSAVGVLAAGYTPDEDAVAWDALADLADRRAITTPVGTVYPFADVPSMIQQ